MELDLSVVVPCFNEEAGLGATVPRILAVLPSLAANYEVVLSDDGSDDRTGSVMERLSRDYTVVRAVFGECHAGKGAALTRGLGAARGKIRAFVDADLEISPDYLTDLVGAIRQGADAAIGSKRLAGPQESDRTATRRLATTTYNTLVKILFGSPLKDHQAGIKAFRGEVVEEILPQMLSEGWIWDTEFLLRALSRGYKVDEVPVTVRPVRTSKVNTARDSIRMLRGLIGLRARGLTARSGPARFHRCLPLVEGSGACSGTVGRSSDVRASGCDS